MSESVQTTSTFPHMPCCCLTLTTMDFYTGEKDKLNIDISFQVIYSFLCWSIFGRNYNLNCLAHGDATSFRLCSPGCEGFDEFKNITDSFLDDGWSWWLSVWTQLAGSYYLEQKMTMNLSISHNVLHRFIIHHHIWRTLVMKWLKWKNYLCRFLFLLKSFLFFCAKYFLVLPDLQVFSVIYLLSLFL